MKLRKSSVYTVRSGSWKVQMGISSRCSLLPLLETWDRARETMVELAWEMPRDSRFSEKKREMERHPVKNKRENSPHRNNEPRSSHYHITALSSQVLDAGRLQHGNVLGTRRETESSPTVGVTLTLHDVILTLERRSPGPGCLSLGRFEAASFVEGMR